MLPKNLIIGLGKNDIIACVLTVKKVNCLKIGPKKSCAQVVRPSLNDILRASHVALSLPSKKAFCDHVDDATSYMTIFIFMRGNMFLWPLWCRPGAVG